MTLREDVEARREAAALAQKAKQEKLTAAFASVAKTRAGRDVLKYFVEQCGYHQTSSVRFAQADAQGRLTFGDILANCTLYNDARRSVWTEARKLIPVALLVPIEMEIAEDVDSETNETDAG